MINLPQIINLDEYLDLTNFESVSKEFKENLSEIDKWSDTGVFSPDKSIKDPIGIRSFGLRIHKDISNLLNWGAIDKHELFEDSPIFLSHFPRLYSFIYNLPFKNIARVFLIYTKDGTSTLPHPDFTLGQESWRMEFMWFSLSGKKRLWTTDYNNTLEFQKNGFVVEDEWEREYMKGTSCWFNPILVHGTDNGDNLSASLRVDGEFTTEFRKQIFGDDEWKTTFDWVDEKYILPEDSSYLKYQGED